MINIVFVSINLDAGLSKKYYMLFWQLQPNNHYNTCISRRGPNILKAPAPVPPVVRTAPERDSGPCCAVFSHTSEAFSHGLSPWTPRPVESAEDWETHYIVKTIKDQSMKEARSFNCFVQSILATESFSLCLSSQHSQSQKDYQTVARKRNWTKDYWVPGTRSWGVRVQSLSGSDVTSSLSSPAPASTICMPVSDSISPEGTWSGLVLVFTSVVLTRI